ncbi:MAG: cysteine synthase A, partial [Clostridia bacterium]|nr:cysteine synthase A [Clostridia bacterium]
MIKIANCITELIGNTPLLEFHNYSQELGLNSRLIGKLEFFNPMGSAKDRVGFAMIKDAEERGFIDKDTVIIEPTSGNTGIGLAFVAVTRGYRIIIVMPDNMSVERIKLLKALGAEVVLTDGAVGMNGAINKAQELAESIKNSYVPQQFKNPANAEIHRKTTGMEILRDTEGKIDYFVAGVGTGGTITGIGEVLKEKNPEIKVVAVEPYNSSVLSGGKPGKHGLQGIGAGFIPSILNRGIIDEVVTVKDEEAFTTMRNLASMEGVMAGISAGAAVYAATILARREENVGKSIVIILPDTGERYLSD